ncbi:hypothetical protein L1987_45607 [Smallanthus sonchifolius]|uniref:Uncharacterized protein n=1 Tax=Smallanthus sonchifolius TaxID=185202 RepID=A0ACB9FY19_9ASTR|nr:hypothetical protein L1987_45607 [Smallanthus sonchifolius]
MPLDENETRKRGRQYATTPRNPNSQTPVYITNTFFTLKSKSSKQSEGLFLSNIRSGRLIELLPSPGLRVHVATILPSLNIRSGRLRAFAFARLESLCCFAPSLDV